MLQTPNARLLWLLAITKAPTNKVQHRSHGLAGRVAYERAWRWLSGSSGALCATWPAAALLPRAPFPMSTSPHEKLLPFTVVLVSALSLLAYVLTLSLYSAWLDAGEFVASAATLGISHPPGHPLHALWSSFFTLIPVGTLSTRVALSSAVAAALGVGAFQVWVFRLLAFAELSRVPRLLIAVATSLAVALSPVLWSQATRPEVYALQFFLSMIVLERLLYALTNAGSETDARRALYTAAFVWGLSLCNHHLLAFLLLPAAMVALQTFSFATALRATGFVFLGLLPYLYLPLRAGQGPIPNFGEPTSVGRFFWLVSAKAFQKNTGEGVPEPWGQRIFDVVAACEAHFSLFGIFAAFAGFYFMMRVSRWRLAGVAFGLACGAAVAARIWLGHTANNPDALGYLATGLSIASAFAALFVGVVVRGIERALARRRKGRARRVGLVVACALPIMACVVPLAVHARRVAEQQDLRSFRDTDSWDDVAFRRAPARSILILHDPETIFRALQYVAEHDVPASDLLVVPTPFLAYPGMIETLVRQEPLLRATLTHYAISGRWDAAQLQSLASSRTLLVQMDPYLDPDVIQTLVPSVFFFEVLSSEAYPEDREAALIGHARGHEHLQRLLGTDPAHKKTRDRFLLHHYNDALYFAAVGQADAAKEAVAHALSLNPHDRHLRALDQALETTQGAVDIRSFVPQNQR